MARKKARKLKRKPKKKASPEDFYQAAFRIVSESTRENSTASENAFPLRLG